MDARSTEHVKRGIPRVVAGPLVVLWLSVLMAGCGKNADPAVSSSPLPTPDRTPTLLPIVTSTSTPDISDNTPAAEYVVTPVPAPLPLMPGTPVHEMSVFTALPRLALPGTFLLHSNAGGSYQIYSMEGDGQNLTQLTFGGGRNIEAAWSPDGSTIAFASARDGSTGLAIYLMDADGGNQRPLVQHSGYALSPSWSPDGKTLVFHANWEKYFQLYTVSVEGGEPRKLFDFPANAYMPDWSPDGMHIAFSGDQHGGNVDVYILDLRDMSVARLTDGRSGEYRPRWSPDGTMVAYHQKEEWDSHIVVLDVETRETVFFHGGTLYADAAPSWAGMGYLACGTTISSLELAPSVLTVLDFVGNRYLLLAEEGDWQQPVWSQ